MASTLDSAELIRRLNAGASLPKDDLIDTHRDGISENRFRHRDRRVERAFLHALTEADASERDRRQALRQANCEPEKLCGELSCWLCKQMHWLRLRQSLEDRLPPDLTRDDVSWVTIIGGICEPKPEQVCQLVADFRRTLLRFSITQGVVAVGRFEIDLITSLNELGMLKERTAKQLGWDVVRLHYGAAVVHAHTVAIHPHLRRIFLSVRLKQTFRGYRRSEARSISNKQTMATALDNLVRYTVKALPPQQALFGRGSRLFRPRDPQMIREYNGLIEVLKQNRGDLILGDV